MSPSKEKTAGLNPRTTSYEFLGPPGAFLVSTTVPLVTYSLHFGCNETTGCPPPWAIENFKERVISSVTDVEWWKGLWDSQAAVAYLGWYTFVVLAWAILPGDWISGTQLRNGKRLQYKINALSTLLLALGIVGGLIYRDGPQAFTFIYKHWVGLLTASLAMSLFQAVAVYLWSFRSGDHLLALGGNSGNILYDWFIGRELNPRIGSFDIKSFNEIRPGLMLWVLIDISMLCEQAVRRGGFANVTDSMWLVVAFHTFYVVDSLYNEPALFTTMDIVTDGFGFMLSMGDLFWVPFSYSTAARYLVFDQKVLGPQGVAGVLAVNALGYWIFRASNSEKNDFRNGHNPKDLKTMDTKRGTKLLIEGWWGMCQHPNYLGDWIMALAWSLPTGFTTPIPYFYPGYFAVLLLHRQNRDDEACQKKYGDDWKKYKSIVRWKIFPGIY